MRTRKRFHDKNTRSNKDYWDKFQILSSFSTAVVLAIATYIGSTVIPEKINQKSNESQKIIELSKLVPQVYGAYNDSTEVRPLIIAVASYGVPAVSYLLRLLDVAIQNGDEEIADAITETMKNMNEDAKNQIGVRLKSEIERLKPLYLSYNVEFIGRIVDIFSVPNLNRELQRILERYIVVVASFEINQREMRELNAKVVQALAYNEFPLFRLNPNLAGLNFEGTNLIDIDFLDVDLSNSVFSDCTIEMSNFDGVNLSFCKLTGTQFDSTSSYSISTTNWTEAILDEELEVLLANLNNREERLGAKR